MAGDKALRIISSAEVAKHNSESSVWVIIDDRVYDVTKFLLEHPGILSFALSFSWLLGGEEVLLQQAGQDATEAFNDVGHSSDARAMTEEYLIGRLPDEETRNSKPPKLAPEKVADGSSWSDIVFRYSL